MAALANYLENLFVDGFLRGGAIDTAGAANSTAVVKGLWTASTAYAVGDIVVPVGNTSAGGKFLLCTTAGTSGATFTTALGNPGSTVADNTATWTVISGMPSLLNLYFGLFTSSKGVRANSTAYSLNDTIVVLISSKYYFYKCTTAGTSAASQAGYVGAAGEAITDGTAVFTEQSASLDDGTAITEVSGGNYARVTVAATKANLAGTQAAASTTASTGTGGTTSNNNAITFPTPNANWHPSGGQVVGLFVSDRLTSGNTLSWVMLTAPKSVNGTDPAPSVAAGTWTLQLDN